MRGLGERRIRQRYPHAGVRSAIGSARRVGLGCPLMGAGPAKWDGALRNLRVLVADDNPDLCMLIEMILSIAGAEVTVVHDGLAAADCLGQAGFDLLLCDAEMPGMGGRELCARLREADHDIPIVMVSGHVGQRAALASRAAGASAHLDKPFTPDGLIACCQLALGARCIT